MDDPVLMACTCDRCNRATSDNTHRPSSAPGVLMISIVGSLAWSLPVLLAYLGGMSR